MKPSACPCCIPWPSSECCPYSQQAVCWSFAFLSSFATCLPIPKQYIIYFASWGHFITGVMVYGFSHELFFSVNTLFLRLICTKPRSYCSSWCFYQWYQMILLCGSATIYFFIFLQMGLGFFPSFPTINSATFNILVCLLLPQRKSIRRLLLEFDYPSFLTSKVAR